MWKIQRKQKYMQNFGRKPEGKKLLRRPMWGGEY
jgi:hypothetical protein